MRFFRLAFGVQPPYRVIVDGTFLSHALQQKIHVKEQLPKLLNGRVTPAVTGCVLDELRSLGDRAHGAAFIAKGYYRLKCGHDENPLGASECIRLQIGDQNERKFLVATQDADLMRALRGIPGVPILRLHGGVPTLEDPSNESRAVNQESQDKRQKPADWEKPKLPVLRQLEAAAAAASTPKKRHGPKGPNPLSCRKPKTAANSAKYHDAAEVPQKPRRVRSRRISARTSVLERNSGQADHDSKGAVEQATGVRKRQTRCMETYEGG